MNKVKYLMFSKKYFNKLINGEKIATIRLNNLNLKPGDKFFIHSGGYVLGLAEVTNLTKKKINELTNEDAVKDGFNDVNELLRNLKQHYPGVKSTTLVNVIEFRWVKKFKEPIPSEKLPWGNKVNIIQIAKIALEKLDSLTDEERGILKLVLEEGSIRRAALKMGGLGARPVVRGVLRKAYMILRKKEHLIK